MRRHRSTLRLEPLETRYAPATLVNPFTLTYQDVDGDSATVRFSKPILGAATIDNVFKFDAGTVNGDNSTPQQLELIDLTALADPQAARGTAIAVTAVRSPANGGDGFANVGGINAVGIDLGAVTIKGDLGDIDAGDTSVFGAAISSLTVQSMGRFGTLTGAPDLHSDIDGVVSKILIKSDLQNVHLDVFSDVSGPDSMQSLTVGGSLIGGVTSDSGFVFIGANIGSVRIGGNLSGAAGDRSGRLDLDQAVGSCTIGGSFLGGIGGSSGSLQVEKTASLRIGGSLLGGDGEKSGNVELNDLGTTGAIFVGGSLVGGLGDESGSLQGVGKFGNLTVRGNVVGGAGEESGRVLAELGIARASVGGSVVGGDGRNSGVVSCFDAQLGPVRVAGDIRGGAGLNSGRVSSDGNFTSIFVGGSVIGGTANSGTILGGDMKFVTIAGDVRGGDGNGSGLVGVSDLARLTIGGSVVGGAGQNSGQLNPNRLTSARISGDLAGGSGESSGSIFATSIGALSIGGSVRSGSGLLSGTIAADERISSIKVGGSLFGNGAHPLLIQAGGIESASGPTDVVLGSLFVKGSVLSTRIVAGISDSFVPINADAQIGTVSVGGDWIGSSLAAGVVPVNGFFGDGNDTLAPAGKNDANVLSKIGSLTIAGQAQGTALANGDVFGIVAEQIGSLSIGGASLPLTAGVGNDNVAVGSTGDFVLDEI